MKNIFKLVTILFVLTATVSIAFMPLKASAATEDGTAIVEAGASQDSVKSAKAIGAAIAIALAAAGGALGMGMAISKSSDSIARQPEAESKIRTTLMLGLVFIETAIIYALIVAILIIFVL